MITISKLLTQKISLKITFQASEIDKMYNKLVNFAQKKNFMSSEPQMVKTKKKIHKELKRVVQETNKLLEMLSDSDSDEDDKGSNNSNDISQRITVTED